MARQIDENEEIPRELITKIAELGLLGTPFPEKHGGGDYVKIGYCTAHEEFTRGCGSTATFIGAHVLIGTNAIYKGNF